MALISASLAELAPRFDGLPYNDAHQISRFIEPGNSARSDALTLLLADKEEALPLLDLEEVQTAIHAQAHRLAPFTVTYAMIRKAVLEKGIDNREVALYLARVCLEFRKSGILPSLGGVNSPLMGTVDILKELNFVQGSDELELLARAGNYFLFLMICFEDHFVEQAERRGRPGISYYEAFTRCSFRAARDHHLSVRYGLWEIYDHLCDRVACVRSALAPLLSPVSQAA